MVGNLTRLLHAKALIRECLWDDEEQEKEMNKIINFLEDEADKLFIQIKVRKKS